MNYAAPAPDGTYRILEEHERVAPGDQQVFASGSYQVVPDRWHGTSAVNYMNNGAYIRRKVKSPESASKVSYVLGLQIRPQADPVVKLSSNQAEPTLANPGVNAESTGASGANSIQHGGNHYKGRAIEPWDYVAANGLGFFEGNAIKYLTRWRDKNGIEDLKKARHYIDKLIEVEDAKAT